MNISDVMPFCFSVFFISFVMYLLRNEKTVKKISASTKCVLYALKNRSNKTSHVSER